MDERACQDLIDAARAHDGPAANRAVEQLFPAVRVYVDEKIYHGELRRLGERVGSSPGDVSSHLGKQLSAHPPRGTDGVRAVASVKSWLKRVARNYLIDLYKAHSKSTVWVHALAHGDAGVTMTGGAAGGAATPGPHDLLAAELHDRAWRGLLDACYPPALPVYDASLDAQGMTDPELADSLGVTVANLHQQRSRMRRYLKAYDYIAEHPRASDAAIAAAVKAQLTPDTARIIARVRHFMITNSWSPS